MPRRSRLPRTSLQAPRRSVHRHSVGSVQIRGAAATAGLKMPPNNRLHPTRRRSLARRWSASLCVASTVARHHAKAPRRVKRWDVRPTNSRSSRWHASMKLRVLARSPHVGTACIAAAVYRRRRGRTLRAGATSPNGTLVLMPVNSGISREASLPRKPDCVG